MRFNDPSSVGSSLLTVDFLMHVSRSRGLATPVRGLWGMILMNRLSVLRSASLGCPLVPACW